MAAFNASPHRFRPSFPLQKPTYNYSYLPWIHPNCLPLLHHSMRPSHNPFTMNFQRLYYSDEAHSNLQTTQTTCLNLSMQIADLTGIEAISKGSNFVFSPLSLATALGLAAFGARGETLNELLTFLGSSNIDHLTSNFDQLLKVVRRSEGELILSFVNGVWLDRSMEINPSFAGVASSMFGAAIEPVDFVHQAEVEQKKINNWIEKNTNGIITNLIPDGMINGSTRLILVNALYFKGKWQDEFDKSMTKTDKFYLLDGSTVEAPFMSSRGRQFISTYFGFKVLKLPYKKEGDDGDLRSFSMLLFLPDKMKDFHNLIKSIVSTPNFVQEHVPHNRVEFRQFMVPKFKISFDFEASEVLNQLGVKSIFSSSSADLGGMCLQSSSLFVSNVFHKAAIEVDEEGTTAAAATALMGSLLWCTQPVDFVADHPFIFVVREDRTGAILFFGHVVNPLI